MSPELGFNYWCFLILEPFNRVISGQKPQELIINISVDQYFLSDRCVRRFAAASM